MKFNRIDFKLGIPTDFLFGFARTTKNGISEFAIGLLFFTIVFVFKKQAYV